MGRGRPKHPDILTPREWEVLALVREGLTNSEIAERLGITLPGARYHVSEILSKLGVSTREEAAAWVLAEEVEPGCWGVALWAKVALGAAAVALLAATGGLAWGLTRGGERSIEHDSSLLPSASATLSSGLAPSRPPASELRLSYVLDGTLYVVDSPEAGRQQLGDTGACAGANLSWSPLVSRILCWDSGEISLLGQDGTSLGSWGEPDVYPDAEWSPGSEAFAYVSSTGVVIRNSEGGEIATLGHADFSPRSISLAGGSPHWSPGGRQFAYWNADAGEMRVYSLDTRIERSFPGDFRPLAWLSDGRTILTAHGYDPPSDLSFTYFDVYLLDTETGAADRLPELEATPDGPVRPNLQAWLSPDTSLAATLIKRDDGLPGLGILDISTRQLSSIPGSIITFGSDFIPPQNVYWSRDGREIYWVDQPGDSIVYRANADGSGLERLGSFQGAARLSADLTTVAFVEYDSALTGTLSTDLVGRGSSAEIASRPGTGGSSSTIPFAWMPLFEDPPVNEERAIGFVIDQLRMEGWIDDEFPQLTIEYMSFGDAAERATQFNVHFAVKPEGYSCPIGAYCPYPGVDPDANGWLVVVEGLDHGPGDPDATGYISWVGVDSGGTSSYLPAPD